MTQPPQTNDLAIVTDGSGNNNENGSESPTVNLEELDHVILDFLNEGARTQAYMIDHAPYPRHQYRERFKILTVLGYVERLHQQTALYELRQDPRPESDIGQELQKIHDGTHPILKGEADVREPEEEEEETEDTDADADTDVGSGDQDHDQDQAAVPDGGDHS